MRRSTEWTRIREAARLAVLHFSEHALDEMDEDSLTENDVVEAILSSSSCDLQANGRYLLLGAGLTVIVLLTHEAAIVWTVYV